MSKVSIEVEAVHTGYYNNRIVHPGQKFLYTGELKNGKLPQWVKGKVPEELKKPAKKAVVSKKTETEEIV